jgi:hypothetical protein
MSSTNIQGAAGKLTVCNHSWSRTGLYSAVRQVAMLDIEGDATEETQGQWEAAMAADARRLVACWNACLTLPTEIIEQGLAESLMQAKEIGRDEAIHAVAKRVQDLVDALAKTETYLLERLSSNPGSTGATVILPLIRRAIEGAGVAPTPSGWSDFPAT